MIRSLMQPHRIVMLAIAAALVVWVILAGNWEWLPKYLPMIVQKIIEMAKRDAKKGLATLCIGGGMGIAMCVER